MAVYYVWSGAGGSNNGSSWANAYTTLTAAFGAEAAGDTLYVAQDHAESTAGTVTLASSGTLVNPTKIVCVDRAGSVPPVSADRRATAQVAATGANNLTLTGSAHYDGIIFNCGSGATTSTLNVGGNSSHLFRLDNCSLRLPGTTGGLLTFGNTSASSNLYELNNTTVSFANVAANIQVWGLLRWRNTPSALLGTIPTALFTFATNRGSFSECFGVDFSAAGSGKTICSIAGSGAVARFIDCKLNASVTKSATIAAPGNVEVDFIRSGAGGNNYAVHRLRYAGALIEETTIVRTGGASDGTTPISWKIDTTAGANFSAPFECPPIAIWNDTTGSAVTATVEGIAATLPTDAEVWLEVEYLGDASSPQGSFVNDGKADLLATAANQTSSSETWGGSTAEFKMSVSFTAQQAGFIYARVKVGKASATVYIDPLVTLT